MNKLFQEQHRVATRRFLATLFKIGIVEYNNDRTWMLISEYFTYE